MASALAMASAFAPQVLLGAVAGVFADRWDRKRTMIAADLLLAAGLLPLLLVRGAGQILLCAHTRRGVMSEVDLASVCVDEKDLLGSYSADFTLQAEVARLVFTRRIEVRRLITHEFPLGQTAAAVELAAHPTAESLKVVVNHCTEVLVAKAAPAQLSSAR